jgi:hypothetical protein
MIAAAPGRYIIGARNDSDHAILKQGISDLFAKVGKGETLREDIKHLSASVYTGVDDAMLAEIKTLPGFEYADPDYYLKPVTV